MDKLIFRALNRLVKKGSLRITTANGTTASFGDSDGPPVAVRFQSSTAQWRVLADPELRLGEAFVDGDMVLDEGTIMDLLELLLSQDATSRPISSRMLAGLRFVLRHFGQQNVRRRSKRNVAHHYDISGKLYDLFLDADRQYSCAYFETDTATLDEAQLAKKRHISAKLLVERDSRVLDIGCGWGGLALYLADTFGAHVTGVTLSTEQLEYAKTRVADTGADRLDFQLLDYRDVTGHFDRIVSVDMFEHVGVDHYDSFFWKCRELLDDDGVLVLHSIGRSDAPGFTNPWIAKYIFPGGYIPALSEVLPSVERSGLVITDIEVLRLHYAETLRHWRQRFLARRAAAVELFDERFARLWEFYLSVSELAFRYQGMMVFQMQIAKRQDAVPLTRGYIESKEARLRRVEAAKREWPKLSVP
ncbi:MAG: class I SAM-dependent methyltransferase [Pseudomonadota bacterium]